MLFRSHAGPTDLVTLNLAYPPGSQPLARLGSGFRDLILHCPRPILAVPQTVSPLERALLAYDSSPKAQEALYVAAYLAGQWNIPLVVVSVMDGGRITQATLDQARQYLAAHNIQAEYVIHFGAVGPALLEAAELHGCDFFILGGYGLNPLLEAVLGSNVDQVMQRSRKPMLICR